MRSRKRRTRNRRTRGGNQEPEPGMTPKELDQRLEEIAAIGGAIKRLDNKDDGEAELDAMTEHLCERAVRLFERSYGVKKGTLKNMNRILNEGVHEARRIAAVDLVERYLRSIMDPRYQDSVFAGLRDAESMAEISEPAMHALGFAQALHRECEEATDGTGQLRH